ncbi:RadC family protein [Haliovirga abyssi]|uniref:UPF0758 protein n=1 Tax=Haliovirga abyssi TaxID=2996794 RepID=A0AAU9D7Y4_9FUSO|nr:DNA repair protein RadC [Haliovirga abyssi]BDU50688.1 UPF0758 protein [Haliovirga abyssi]
MKKELLNGHRKRLKEKYLNSGANGLHKYEILELLLTYAIPRKDCKIIAKELLNEYGNFTNIFSLTKEELMEINGIGENSAILINIINEILKINLKEKLNKKNKIENTLELIEYLKAKLSNNSKELFIIIFLDSKNGIIKDEILFEGTLDRNYIYPRELIKKIIFSNAKKVIFAHNHPSGDETPSKNDIKFTKKTKNILEEIEVELLDHIILTTNNYYSFLENNLI